MCGCGCELALILATARQSVDAPAMAPGAPSGAPPRPDVFGLAGRALVDAIDRVVMSIVERVSCRGAIR